MEQKFFLHNHLRRYAEKILLISCPLSDDMKTLISVVFVLTMAAGLVKIMPPRAEQILGWAAFSKPVHLKAEKIDHGDFFKFGEPIWVYCYSANKETLSTYVIGLYKAGSLFGNHRAGMEKRIEEQVERFKKLSEKFPAQNSEEMAKHIQIETRPNGRKVYFTIMGFGPGGVAYGGFTRIGDFDLLLQKIVDFEDDMPLEQKLKEPAEPKTAFLDIFRRLEEYINKQITTH